MKKFSLTKNKKETAKELAHTDIYHDGTYIGYVIRNHSKFAAVNENWNFVGKQNYVKNVIEDIQLEDYICSIFNRKFFKFFFFSNLRVEKIYNNIFLDIFFFDEIAASFFNNSILFSLISTLPVCFFR